MADLAWARRWNFGYGDEPCLSRGQVIELGRGIAGRDQMLVDLGYLVKIDKGAQPFPCRECGKQFVELQYLNAHGRDAHSGRVLTPQEELERQNRDEVLAQAAAPLYLDKTSEAKGVKRRGRRPTV